MGLGFEMKKKLEIHEFRGYTFDLVREDNWQRNPKNTTGLLVFSETDSEVICFRIGLQNAKFSFFTITWFTFNTKCMYVCIQE